MMIICKCTFNNVKLNLENNLNFKTSTLIFKIYHNSVIQQFKLHVIHVKLDSNKKKFLQERKNFND